MLMKIALQDGTIIGEFNGEIPPTVNSRIDVLDLKNETKDFNGWSGEVGSVAYCLFLPHGGKDKIYAVAGYIITLNFARKCMLTKEHPIHGYYLEK